jgi:hypothetical protein
MIVRGFEMEKGVDYVDYVSPTPGLAVARLMLSLAIANDMELHKIEMEQAFLQALLLHHVTSSVDFQDLALQRT